MEDLPRSSKWFLQHQLQRLSNFQGGRRGVPKPLDDHTVVGQPMALLPLPIGDGAP
jgi:hypothetical protein